MSRRRVVLIFGLAACATSSASTNDTPADVAAVRASLDRWTHNAAAFRFDSLTVQAAPDFILVGAGQRYTLPEYIEALKGLHADSLRAQIDSATVHTNGNLAYAIYASRATVGRPRKPCKSAK